MSFGASAVSDCELSLSVYKDTNMNYGLKSPSLFPELIVTDENVSDKIQEQNIFPLKPK